ncbi:MAG: hypothetical protein AB1430_19870 [Pseudomonadota bacterium]
MKLKIVASAAVVALMAGCATQGGSQTAQAPASSAAKPAAAATATQPSDVRIVKSRDGKFEGEVIGTPAPGSKFAKLQIGMEFNEVTKLIGGPSSMHTHETGKRWIPFYFGNDATRMQADYAGEGCLAFTGGSVFGGGGNELVRITADPSGAKCKE